MATVPTGNKGAFDGNLVNGETSEASAIKNYVTDIANTVNTNDSGFNAHVTSATLPHADGSVTTPKLADSVVTTAKIATGAVTTAKIANGAVGATQLDGTLLAEYGDIAVQAEFARRAVNVVTYGATGDGVTNDTAAIQAAINASNGILYFPPGTYIVTTLYVKSGIKWVGAGYTRTIIKSSADAPVITKLNTSDDVSNLHIEGMRIENTHASTTQYVIDIWSDTSVYTGARFSVFRDLYVIGNYGIKLKRIWCTRLDNIRTSCQYQSLYLVDGCNNITVRNCMWVGGQVGGSQSVYLEGSPTQHANILFDGCTFENNIVRALYAYNILGFSLKDGYFESAEGPTILIRLENCPSANIEGNYVRCPSTMVYFAELRTTSANASLNKGKAKFTSNVFTSSTSSMSVFNDAESKLNTIVDQSNSADGMKFASYQASTGNAPRQPTYSETITTSSFDMRFTSGQDTTPSIKIESGWYVSSIVIVIDTTYAGATAQTINCWIYDSSNNAIGRMDTGSSSLGTSGTAGNRTTVALKTTSPTYRDQDANDGNKIRIFGGNGGGTAIMVHAEITLTRFHAL